MGEKQYPNTSTPSYPHEGNFGKIHVDIEHRGPEGKVESKTKHVTEPGMINLGQKRKEANESNSNYSGDSGK